jgi:hypothetical protein
LMVPVTSDTPVQQGSIGVGVGVGVSCAEVAWRPAQIKAMAPKATVTAIVMRVMHASRIVKGRRVAGV